MCVSVLLISISVHHMHDPWRSEEDTKFPGTGVKPCYEPSCLFSESNLSLLEEQPLLLTAEPSLQPLLPIF